MEQRIRECYGDHILHTATQRYDIREGQIRLLDALVLMDSVGSLETGTG